MQTIIKHIASKTLVPVYLLYGEAYLVKLYEKKLCDAVTQNYVNIDVLEDEALKLIDIATTLSFFDEKRVIIVRNSGLFSLNKKSESDNNNIINFLNNNTSTLDSCTIIFNEISVDKRSKLFKAISKVGYCCEFKMPSEHQLAIWCKKKFINANISIENESIIHLLRTVEYNMETIEGETQKLISFAQTVKQISKEDINNLCVKSLETKIFDLVDAVSTKKPAAALEIFNNLVQMKESPLMIVSMIARQFRLILQCKILAEQNQDAASTLGIRSFVANECIKQGKIYDIKTLIGAIKDCLITDVNIKTGKINDRTAVETLIMKYSI